jgi:glycerol-3-phosphate dehydrogenase
VGRGFTKKPAYLSTCKPEEQEPVIDTTICRGGIEYSDACLHDNDARFVFNFVRSAIDKGYAAVNYLSASKAELGSELFMVASNLVYGFDLRTTRNSAFICHPSAYFC